ncbi:hypothetical protein EGK75_06660 [Neisseria weixii]|nr:hypothetical protein CGZ65_04975 [Neisseria weixii]RPD87617.1 hypothetical protein EGK75_06660 [Neisseria weixii]
MMFQKDFFIAKLYSYLYFSNFIKILCLVKNIKLFCANKRLQWERFLFIFTFKNKTKSHY